MFCWSFFNKLIQKSDPSFREECIFESLFIHTSRLGGSIDIDVTDETVIALQFPSSVLLERTLTEYI